MTKLYVNEEEILEEINKEINEEEILEEINKEINEDEIIDQIKSISLTAWQGKIEKIEIINWLNNFYGQCFAAEIERKMALWLALNFVLYCDRDVRALCKHLWQKYIHKELERREVDDVELRKNIKDAVENIMNETYITVLGNLSESGAYVAYVFRQENDLSSDYFSSENRNIKNIILLDDVTLSGNQASIYIDKYIKNIENKGNKDDLKQKIYILTFFSTEEAVSKLKNKATIISAIELGQESQCFSDESYVFHKKKKWMPIFRDFCNVYGKKISNFPLGYSDGQYTFGFHYNTPDNVLPIFWSTKDGWNPLFKRYNKNENKGEELKQHVTYY